MAEKIVEVPGLGTVAFPDTMSDDEISGHIRNQLGTSNGLGPVASFGSALASTALAIPRELYQFVTNHPEWTLQHSGMGGASGDIQAMPGTAQAERLSARDPAGALGTTVMQAGMGYGLGKLAGPQALDTEGVGPVAPGLIPAVKSGARRAVGAVQGAASAIPKAKTTLPAVGGAFIGNLIGGPEGAKIGAGLGMLPGVAEGAYEGWKGSNGITPFPAGKGTGTKYGGAVKPDLQVGTILPRGKFTPPPAEPEITPFPPGKGTGTKYGGPAGSQPGMPSGGGGRVHRTIKSVEQEAQEKAEASATEQSSAPGKSKSVPSIEESTLHPDWEDMVSSQGELNANELKAAVRKTDNAVKALKKAGYNRDTQADIPDEQFISIMKENIPSFRTPGKTGPRGRDMGKFRTHVTNSYEWGRK